MQCASEASKLRGPFPSGLFFGWPLWYAFRHGVPPAGPRGLRGRAARMNAANNKNRPLQMINQTDVRPLTGYFTHDRIAVPNPLPEAPERPERLDVIERNMLALGMDALVRVHYAKPAPIESVILAHDLEYVRRLEAASAGDPAALATFDAPDTRVGPDTFDAAMKSAGAVVEAVDELYAGRIKNAFCGVRPPGHHAARAEARGFCYLNNVAIGAYWAMRRHGARRVAIVDFDAHHGDGTEEIVANHPDIRFMSLFQWPLYPHRMMEPTPKNVVVSPVAAGADGAVFTDILENVWLPQLEAFRPDIIFVSAGFDAHVEEQMAQLKVKELDYARITRRLLDAADVLCEGRLVSVLEGGYAVRSLARSVMAHLNMLVMRGRTAR